MEVINVVKTLPRHTTKRYSIRATGFINGTIIHHSAGGVNQTPEQIAAYHVNTRHYPGVGYHFMIDKMGRVFKTQNQTTLSYHAGAGQNKKHLGICLIGNFEQVAPSVEQIHSLEDLLVELLRVYPGWYVQPHQWVHATACPGKNLVRLLPGVVSRARARATSAPVPEPRDGRTPDTGESPASPGQ